MKKVMLLGLSICVWYKITQKVMMKFSLVVGHGQTEFVVFTSWQHCSLWSFVVFQH